MVVLDRDGSFLRSWGEGLFSRAHGLHINTDDDLYCTDDGPHRAQVLNRRQGPADDRRPRKALAIHERRSLPSLYPLGAVTEGRDLRLRRLRQRPRSQIHAKLIKSWGEPGTDPGQFNIVHNIVADSDGWVYVADREDHRVQVFDRNGF
jgi:hypothetical protein